MTPSGWIAVATARSLGARPMRIVIDSVPIVVFRTAKGLSALFDQCPHRGAPLSLGSVADGQLACAYHGWRFDGDGVCRSMPGHLGEVPACRVAAFAVTEVEGIVFVALRPQTVAPYVGAIAGKGYATALVTNQVRSTLADVAENILDATHTHYVHRGLLRGLTAKRYRVTVTVSGGDGWVEARYEGEPRQEGLVSRLMEGERSISVGRFVAPGIAEIEFWGRQRVNLVTTFHLRQETAERVSGIGRLAGPAQHGLGYLKGLLFKPLLYFGIAQDRHVLQAATDNRALTGQRGSMMGPLDILRPAIDDILAGRRPAVADRPMTVEMEL